VIPKVPKTIVTEIPYDDDRRVILYAHKLKFMLNIMLGTYAELLCRFEYY
jgi:hypothetical protein